MNTLQSTKVILIRSLNLFKCSSSTRANLSKFVKTQQIQLIHKRCFSLTRTKFFQDEDSAFLNEDIYWKTVKTSLEKNEMDERNQLEKETRFLDYKVFVLQLKMQYRSKSRQSTTPELQMNESIALAHTLNNCRVIDSQIVSTKQSNSREIFGSGNQEMLSKRIAKSGANCLFVVIDRLTNMQVEAIRKSLLGNNQNIKIYDRYTLVLDIFKSNARSNIAKLQIALAEIPYIRHKFENTELFKNVERKIKKELELKLKTRALMYTNRLSKNIPTVSVFGYTNVGKTSFIKEITNDAKMNPENKLFATLDVTYHDTTILNSAQKIIFTDTIGFISDIPFTLIESFKASISDALNADLYIHLVDMSHPDRLVQEQTVNKILKELAPEKKLKSMLTVYNKYDQAEPLEKTKEEVDNSVFFISCKTLFGFDHLRREIEARILKLLDYIELNLKVEQGGQELAFLYKNSIIKEIKQLENVQQSQFCVANVYMNKENALKLIHLFPNIKICK